MQVESRLSCFGHHAGNLIFWLRGTTGNNGIQVSIILDYVYPFHQLYVPTRNTSIPPSLAISLPDCIHALIPDCEAGCPVSTILAPLTSSSPIRKIVNGFCIVAGAGGCCPKTPTALSMVKTVYKPIKTNMMVRSMFHVRFLLSSPAVGGACCLPPKNIFVRKEGIPVNLDMSSAENGIPSGPGAFGSPLMLPNIACIILTIGSSSPGMPACSCCPSPAEPCGGPPSNALM